MSFSFDIVAYFVANRYNEMHPERWQEFGLSGPDDLPDFLDDLYQNGQKWKRPDGATAYVNTKTGDIFINNPKNPTAFRNPNYKRYLSEDDFKKID